MSWATVESPLGVFIRFGEVRCHIRLLAVVGDCAIGHGCIIIVPYQSTTAFSDSDRNIEITTSGMIQDAMDAQRMYSPRNVLAYDWNLRRTEKIKLMGTYAKHHIQFIADNIEDGMFWGRA
jgi:hypothetical protein